MANITGNAVFCQGGGAGRWLVVCLKISRVQPPSHVLLSHSSSPSPSLQTLISTRCHCSADLEVIALSSRISNTTRQPLHCSSRRPTLLNRRMSSNISFTSNSSASSTPTKATSSASPMITPLHDPAHGAKVLPQAKPLGAVNREFAQLCRTSFR